MIDGDTEARLEGRLDVANKLLGLLRRKRENVDLLNLTRVIDHDSNGLDVANFSDRLLDVLNADLGRTVVHIRFPLLLRLFLRSPPESSTCSEEEVTCTQ